MSSLSVPLVLPPLQPSGVDRAGAMKALRSAARTPKTAAATRAAEADKLGKGFEEILVRQLLRASGLSGIGGGENGYGSMAVDALASAIVAEITCAR